MIGNIVIDTYLIRDLADAGALDKFLLPPVKAYITDLAVSGLTEKKYKDIVVKRSESGSPIIKKYSEDELFQLLTFWNNMGCGDSLSLADCSVIYLAKELNCPLVSSDTNLCSLAESFVETRLSKYDWSAKTGYIYELIPFSSGFVAGTMWE